MLVQKNCWSKKFVAPKKLLVQKILSEKLQVNRRYVELNEDIPVRLSIDSLSPFLTTDRLYPLHIIYIVYCVSTAVSFGLNGIWEFDNIFFSKIICKSVAKHFKIRWKLLIECQNIILWNISEIILEIVITAFILPRKFQGFLNPNILQK